MKLLLVYLLVIVVIGLYSDRLGRKTYGLIFLTAMLTTLLYFSLRRFMV